MKSILVAAAFLATLSGCANFTSPARNSTLATNTIHWLDYDATRRGAYVVPGDVKIRACAEPSPDAALSLVSKLETESKPGTDADAKERTAKAEFNSTVVDLASRTQTVNFLRESLFRLCEQSLKQDFTPQQTLDAYKAVIAIALAVAQADASKAEEQASRAKAALAVVQKTSDPTQLMQNLNALPK